jgi:hypothetical protein
MASKLCPIVGVKCAIERQAGIRRSRLNHVYLRHIHLYSKQ